MAAEKSVSVVQGSTAALEVYVSGYPIPTSSQITWYYPNDNMVLDTDTGVEFQDTGRRLILSNVQPQQVGAYDCKVVLSDMNATTTIELNVYSKYKLINSACTEIIFTFCIWPIMKSVVIAALPTSPMTISESHYTINVMNSLDNCMV